MGIFQQLTGLHRLTCGTMISVGGGSMRFSKRHIVMASALLEQITSRKPAAFHNGQSGQPKNKSAGSSQSLKIPKSSRRTYEQEETLPQRTANIQPKGLCRR